jgi:hypothetical protein
VLYIRNSAIRILIDLSWRIKCYPSLSQGLTFAAIRAKILRTKMAPTKGESGVDDSSLGAGTLFLA